MEAHVLCFDVQGAPIRSRRAAFTRSWEKVVAIFVEGHGHDAVGQVEGLLYTVAVVNVDINVENPGVVSEEHTELKKKKQALAKSECVSVLL